MRVLRGTPCGGIFVRSQQPLKFLKFCTPLFVFSVKDLRKTTPADIAHKDALFVRGGRLCTVFLKLFEKADSGDIVGIFCLGAAGAEVYVRSYAEILSCVSMPEFSKISQSLIPLILASLAVSLFRTCVSFCCCSYSLRSKAIPPCDSSFFSSSGLFIAQRSRIEKARLV